MRKVRILALAATLSAVLTAVMGSYVRGMGAGLACPDWPLCHGKIIPPLEGAILLEWTHRLIALVVILLVSSILILTWRYRVRERFWALLAFLLLLGQAILGGLTVLMRLHPVVVALHQGMALVFFGSLVVIAARAPRLASETT
ncbi:MAG: hypothetical protein GXP39_12765 [Chloroflexi bacterium]|nr:hypothetical protein [Chloroflexota bacterium]